MSETKIMSFRDLETWQVAMDLAVGVHRVAEQLPPSHRYELGSQVRKAATSVPSNVAEGHAHRGERTFLRHIRIALGSLAEVETQLEVAIRLQFLRREDTKSIEEFIRRTGQLLHGLERSLKRRIQKVVPLPGSLSISSRPLCSSANPRTIARPRPAPSSWRVYDEST